jgi:glycine/D-amino acid oxidase-like deaminating enzyme
MKKLVQFVIVATLFCLPFVQGGCLKAPESGVSGAGGAVHSEYKAAFASSACEKAVNESARDIPVVYDVDVVVVGGTSGGVAAAAEAAQKGARVFLAAARPYLGEDLCGTYRLWLRTDEEPTSPLAKKIFAESPATPMQVKRALDEALLEAGVQFLFGCYATDVLREASGEVAGIVIANRSGRQAVRAKVIIDATPRANVARMAGAAFEPYPAGLQSFKRIVVGGDVRNGEDIQAQKMPTPIPVKDGPTRQAIEYTLKILMSDGSFASFARAEQIARDKTWHPGQVDASEMLFQVPPDAMKGKKSLRGLWPGAEKVNLDAFRPMSAKRLFVLGGCADISRSAAARLLRPLELMKVGSRIGAAAALEAKAMARPRNVRLCGEPVTPVASGDIRENLSGLRPFQTEPVTVPADERAVPVLGEVDVVVVGGGTGGAPTGISAARQGAKTVVVEYLHGLGGVGTLGLISKYYYGYIKGFTKEIDEGVISLAVDGKS